MKGFLLLRSVLILFFFMLMLAYGMAQIAPPAISSSMPPGAQRGTTMTLTIEGINLAGADGLVFSAPGLSAKITSNTELPTEKRKARPGVDTGAIIEDRSTKNKLTADVTIAADMLPGRYAFRVKTPLGLTNTSALTVGEFKEVTEKEPNNSPATAQKVTLPVTVVGAISEAGDVDYFSFEAQAGQQLVFEISAQAIRSGLDSVITLLDAQGNELARADDNNGMADSVLGYRFKEAGRYLLRLTDAMSGGSGRHYYRLTMGELPYITQVFPLGIPRQGGAEVTLEGFNLGDATKAKLAPPATAPFDEMYDPKLAETAPIPFKPPKGSLLNKPRIAIGDYPEIFEQEPNDDLAHAQTISIPVTINGRIHHDKGSATPDQDVYRFTAKAGQKLVFNVMAQRLGSPLDSVIEILDAQGQPIPRATVRCLYETFLNFRDSDSQGGGMRLAAWNGIRANDYMMVGNELLQVEALPKSPDEDLRFKTYRGRRIPFEGTTSTIHPLNSPVYKVSVHKPTEKLPPNGMPVFHITYSNDDGGPIYGKDSHLDFEAPADGTYHVRIKDVRDLQGKRFAYRLTIAEPRPDFALVFAPSNLNVPQGDAVPLTVTVDRKDGFAGPVEVQVLDLPPGLSATAATIPPTENSVSLTLSAAPTAVMPAPGAPFRVLGKAMINGREVAHFSDADEKIHLISVAPPPDLLVSVEPRQLELEPGSSVEVTATIRRANGFAGRVPLSVRNLPAGVIVPDVGLNGILITESEDRRTFRIEADSTVASFDQLIYVTGRVETTSPIASEHASVPIRLRVRPRGNEPAQAAVRQK
jgi:hypothetical protein